MLFVKKKNIAKFLLALTLVTGAISFANSARAESTNHHGNSSVMSEMQEKQKKIDALINEAKKSEKLYTIEEILNISDNQFPKAGPEEARKIKAMMKNTLSELSAENKKKYNETKFPLSMIYIDKSASKSDASLSGGGLPYCLDDNGWGWGNFAGSDCSLAIALDTSPICKVESLPGYPNEWRYCRADLWRNCSGTMGHSGYWHTH